MRRTASVASSSVSESPSRPTNSPSSSRSSALLNPGSKATFVRSTSAGKPELPYGLFIALWNAMRNSCAASVITRSARFIFGRPRSTSEADDI